LRRTARFVLDRKAPNRLFAQYPKLFDLETEGDYSWQRV